LYKQLVNQQDLSLRWSQIMMSLKSPLLLIVFIMMFMNWGMESLKWMILMKPREKISFYNAFKSVLAGCSITMLTPNRTGEFGGRILFVKPENRISAISAAIFGSISQLTITFIIGSAGLLYLKFYSGFDEQTLELNWFFNNAIFYISVFFSVVLILLYFRVNFLIRLISNFRIFNKIIQHISIIDTYSRKDLLRILFYSLIRYLVFILQFALMLRLMNVGIDFTLLLWLLSVFYLMMAIIPTIGFTELPVRATASVLILSLFSNNILGIEAGAFGIWIINLVFPSVIGGIFILGTKIVR
jgi:hypothetical protein